MDSDLTLYNHCILYSLPKDVTTQAIGEKTIENSLQKIKEFLKLFSNVSEIDFYMLVAYVPQPTAKNYEAGLRKIAEAKAVLGLGVESPIGYYYPEGDCLPQRKIEWEFNVNESSLYLDFIIQQQPIPAFELPLFELIGIANFRLVDEQRKELPGQSHSSSLMVWLGRNSAISPVIWMPFVNLSEEFTLYKNRLASKFPGKFNDRYLRRIVPNRAGSSYQVRKI